MIFVVYLIYLWKLNFFLFCKYLELFVCVSGFLISMLEFILERVRGCVVVIDGIFEFLVLVVWVVGLVIVFLMLRYLVSSKVVRLR